MLSSSLIYLQKQTMQTKTYQFGQVLTVLPNHKLLGDSRHLVLLQEIQQLSGVSDYHFKSLYRIAINRFAEFVQVLPEEPQGSLMGLLNLGLARATLALRKYTSEPGIKPDSDPLINYAIFTAALFLTIPKAFTNQKVLGCDEHGEFTQEWHPYSGSMSEQKIDFYKFYPYQISLFDRLNHESAALIARQLMSLEGFLWLSSDLELFMDWLSALRGDESEGGRKIRQILSLLRHEDIMGLLKTLSAVATEVITPKELPLEDQCFAWIQDSIKNGALAVNTTDANIHLLDDGTVYINFKLVELFAEHRKLTIDPIKLAGVINQRFGYQNYVAAQEKAAYANFLLQRGDPRTVQIRNGMLAFGGLFRLDKSHFPASPSEKEIRSVFHSMHKLPIEKAVNVATNKGRPASTFRLR
ncbi:MAG: TraI domain-containing protein [Proteobacteria bacterium]|nr:TraI domain-containing protein [Pseudomonadota bacterium]